MTREECLEELSGDEEVVFLEPAEFDVAIIGVAREFCRPARIAYSAPKVIAVYASSGMSDEEALEYFDFNTAGAYMGEATPVFVHGVPPCRCRR
jgi:hypothetical protein